MVVTRAFIEKNPEVAARFVKASLEGWRDYLKNPAPANVLIKADNPKMRDDQLDYALATLKRIKAVDGGDAATLGIGMMTEARWKQTYEFLVAGGLLKPEVNWKAGFTDRFVKDLKIVP
jgi:NitT/TauT family transport system substrate-binding protein